MKHVSFLFILLLSNILIGQEFHTEYHYPTNAGESILIQNSYPKGGLDYTDAYGKTYAYFVFWTQVTNKTSKPLQLSVDFPLETSSVNPTYFQLYVPEISMTLENIQKFDYGLDVSAYLNQQLGQKSDKVTHIAPGKTSMFYVVALSEERISGVARAGFQLEGKQLVYTINTQKTNSGTLQ
ncbi:hypothetical protein SAMN05216480_11265 [Pustulibacterium marinum]|uniref:Uncharacterized protein n=1 Tax=Pustulibacterium marinum TaxID=1224947 RepID=A0A1I7I1G9_9FLAO|nr:hypothetical protein [Pustulibacterium marinum]SFU66799.1 hypothetical protein SAMN05216480_11265 [Pustulibacterium marinum]